MALMLFSADAISAASDDARDVDDDEGEGDDDGDGAVVVNRRGVGGGNVTIFASSAVMFAPVEHPRESGPKKMRPATVVYLRSTRSGGLTKTSAINPARRSVTATISKGTASGNSAAFGATTLTPVGKIVAANAKRDVFAGGGGGAEVEAANVVLAGVVVVVVPLIIESVVAFICAALVVFVALSLPPCTIATRSSGLLLFVVVMSAAGADDAAVVVAASVVDESPDDAAAEASSSAGGGGLRTNVHSTRYAATPFGAVTIASP